MSFPGLIRITTYFVYKNEKELFTTTDRNRYLEVIKGYTKLPVSGEDRRKLYNIYKASVDKITVHIIGNYSDMGTYIEEYYS